MKYFFLLLFSVVSLFNIQSSRKTIAIRSTGTVKITFVNTVKGKPLQLNTGTYINPFAEVYSVTKFKYYISHVALAFNSTVFNDPEIFHLVDESNADALHFSFSINAGSYNALNFLLGVDSIYNVSGAQTGALDPLNDMFWTWNNGYVMAKMEGHSPQSKLVNNKVEFHIGGFMVANNVLKNIALNFPAGKSLTIQEGKTSELIIEADFDKWWQQPNDIKITEHAVCTTPGPLAKKIADNYSKMFSIKAIIN
jgi:hypothetical protein